MRKILKIAQLKNIYVENIPKVQQQQLHRIITLDLHDFQTWSSSLESSLVVLFSLHIALKIFREPSFLLISEFCNHFIIVDSLTRFGADKIYDFLTPLFKILTRLASSTPFISSSDANADIVRPTLFPFFLGTSPLPSYSGLLSLSSFISTSSSLSLSTSSSSPILAMAASSLSIACFSSNFSSVSISSARFIKSSDILRFSSPHSSSRSRNFSLSSTIRCSSCSLASCCCRIVPLEDLVSLTQNLPSGVYQMTACLRDKTLQSNMALFSAALLLAIKRPTMHSTFGVKLMFCGDPLLRSRLMLLLCPVDLEDLTAAQLLPLSYHTSGVMVGLPLNGSVDCVPVAGRLNFPELEASKVFVFENEVPSISSSTPKLLRAVGSADPVVGAVIPFVISPCAVDFITFVTAMVSVFDVVVGAVAVVRAVVSAVVLDKATATVVGNVHVVAADNVVVGVAVAIVVAVAFGSEGAALLSPVGLCSSSLLFCHSLLTKTITVEIKI
uniref:Uncharacterized protein n=1 Tax=Glossina pallidipes TaxID=7398 RepID=A0A1A9ZW04_GLOPL